MWMRNLGVSTWDNGMAIALGSDDVLRVVGNRCDYGPGGRPPGGVYLLFALALDLGGQLLWETEWSVAQGIAVVRDATLCGADAICATGWVFEEGNLPHTDVFLSKLDSTGQHLWSRSYPSPAAAPSHASTP
jgi:hypothetical protein